MRHGPVTCLSQTVPVVNYAWYAISATKEWRRTTAVSVLSATTVWFQTSERALIDESCVCKSSWGELRTIVNATHYRGAWLPATAVARDEMCQLALSYAHRKYPRNLHILQAHIQRLRCSGLNLAKLRKHENHQFSSFSFQMINVQFLTLNF